MIYSSEMPQERMAEPIGAYPRGAVIRFGFQVVDQTGKGRARLMRTVKSCADVGFAADHGGVTANVRGCADAGCGRLSADRARDGHFLFHFLKTGGTEPRRVPFGQ